VDSFLDASLVFARDAQTYLLSLSDGSVSAEIHARAQDALASYLAAMTRSPENKVGRARARGLVQLHTSREQAPVPYPARMPLLNCTRSPARKSFANGMT
jgi:hypothetical protein